MQVYVIVLLFVYCILSNSSNLCELVQFNLQQEYSPPILIYAIAAIRISDKQLQDLNSSWNSLHRHIFFNFIVGSLSSYLYMV